MRRKGKYDYILLTLVLALVGFGIVMVYSTTAIIAGDRFQNPYYFLIRQAVYAGVGLLLMVFMVYFPYGRLKRWAYPVFGLCILLLIAVLIPGIGHRAGGSMRWLKFQGFFLSALGVRQAGPRHLLGLFSDQEGGKDSELLVRIPSTIVLSGGVIALVLKEPDFGAATFLTVMVFLLLFVSGARVIYLAGSCLLAAPIVYYFLTSAAYRYRRLLSFIRPWDDPSGSSFQIVQSFLSFGSGGLFGVGLGEGKQKLFFLPAPHTDFIFSLVGEELGLVGAMVVLLLFFIIMMRGVHIAYSIEDRFGAYLAMGLPS